MDTDKLDTEKYDRICTPDTDISWTLRTLDTDMLGSAGATADNPHQNTMAHLTLKKQ